MFRGRYTARLDEKGRLKLPAHFKALVEEHFGTALYLTSFRDASIRVYPLATWQAIEGRLAKLPSTNPLRSKFTDRVSYFGHDTEFDTQGRLIVPLHLRELAGLVDDVAIVGCVDFLEMWNDGRLRAKVMGDPITDADLHDLSGLGV